MFKIGPDGYCLTANTVLHFQVDAAGVDATARATFVGRVE